MLPVETTDQCSEADAVAIVALFRRIAERGRKIRLQEQAVHSDPIEEVQHTEALSLQTGVAGENGQSS